MRRRISRTGCIYVLEFSLLSLQLCRSNRASLLITLFSAYGPFQRVNKLTALYLKLIVFSFRLCKLNPYSTIRLMYTTATMFRYVHFYSILIDLFSPSELTPRIFPTSSRGLPPTPAFQANKSRSSMN
ncbi:hypothetical protein CC78DRAFT_327827 [Lojkania enalia]|uniref:Uncharacterized protein n=1 Tax=Lojkania enalia TaxID=147567 RepID=A0A9P4K9I9_9PLEO|nr:hypothetical protein CC78DRAFT_327827 [Didymosphaeria enalia]